MSTRESALYRFRQAGIEPIRGHPTCGTVSTCWRHVRGHSCLRIARRARLSSEAAVDNSHHAPIEL